MAAIHAYGFIFQWYLKPAWELLRSRAL